MKSVKRGFTLVELLVVISVIAILSSLILVGITRVKKNAEILKVRNFVTGVSDSFTNFQASNNKRLFPWGKLSVVDPTGYITPHMSDCWRELCPGTTLFSGSVVINTKGESFVDVDPKRIQSGNIVVDSWDTPYEAQYDYVLRKVVVWSAGDDTVFDFGGNGSPSVFLNNKNQKLGGNRVDHANDQRVKDAMEKDIVSPL